MSQGKGPEEFRDRWSPETPVRRTDDEGEAYLSLADAARRIARNAGTSEEQIRRSLAAGRSYATPFARYELVTEVTA